MENHCVKWSFIFSGNFLAAWLLIDSSFPGYSALAAVYALATDQ
jgi:hypothetical protein